MSTTDDSGEFAQRLDQLYREVGPQLLAWFFRRHGNRAVAEDLLHETFAAVMRHPERLGQFASPRAYLFGVARNLSVDTYRRGAAVEALPAEPFVNESTPPDTRLEVMREAIAKLNPALREVLDLRLQAELSYEEISAVLDIPVGTVRSRLHHAVRQLRQTVNRTVATGKANYES